MRILILGAYGLIGSVITARLLADGHDVIGGGRHVSDAARRQPSARWIRADLSTFTTADWAGPLSGVDAIINAAGALQDGAGDSLVGVHVTGVIDLAEAARAAGVRRFVQISAVGADPDSTLPFLRTKGQAEAALRATDLDWVILRPAFVLAAQAFGGSALLRGLAAFPGLIPAVDAGSIVQVVSAEDVAEAVARSIAPDAPSKITCDLAAAEETTLGAILVSLRGWLGLPKAALVSLPGGLGRLAAVGADALALLGWRSPLRSTALTQLSSGVRGRADDCADHFGFTPWTLPETLSARPAGVQDRWFARLYFAGPAALTILALFWMVSGVIGLLRIDAAASVLIQSGLPAALSRGFVIAGGAADLLLGVAALHRRTARWALKGMIAVTAAYLAGATVWRPDLWVDPLGVLVKTIPAALLAWITLALLDER